VTQISKSRKSPIERLTKPLLLPVVAKQLNCQPQFVSMLMASWFSPVDKSCRALIASQESIRYLWMVRCSFARDYNMDTLLTQTNLSVSTDTRTLCDVPLLIGEMLRRADRRSRQRAIRQARFQKFRAFFGVR
jgi:hypothetical protein